MQSSPPPPVNARAPGAPTRHLAPGWERGTTEAGAAMASALERLQRLNTTTAVCGVLEDELGLSDRTMAEFVISLEEGQASEADFARALEENDADFDAGLVHKLYSVIVASRASAPRGAAAAGDRGPPRDRSAAAGAAAAGGGRGEPPLHAGRGFDGGPARGPGRDEDRPAAALAPAGGAAVPSRPELYGIYRGEAARVSESACDVRLSRGQFLAGGDFEGVVRAQNVRRGAAHGPASTDAREHVGRGQQVWVKVISAVGARLQLSMKDVDQATGRDLLPQRQRAGAGATEDAASAGRSLDGGSTAGGFPSAAAPSPHGAAASASASSSSSSAGGVGGRQRMVHRPPSPEQFAVGQLIRSGVLPAEAYPTYDPETGVLDVEEAEEEVDVEIVDDEAPFLRGSARLSGEVSPVKVVKNPEGSLQRAAMTQLSLQKERKEMRQQQQRDMLDAIPKDMASGWQDPAAEAGARLLADEVRGLGGAGAAGGAVGEWRARQAMTAVARGQISSKSIREQRESLPIRALRDDFLAMVREHQVMVVVGETGSGKTTQMTQYLAEAGFTAKGIVGCTQPRRVAATSVAERVSEEVGCRLGEEVGYSIRFNDMTSPSTVIKYMTDGMLLREYLMDNDLKRYSVIILDEAHERTINTDVLFGLLKALVKKRTDLRVIATSATLDADKFAGYWFDCPVMRIPGRTFPVTTKYLKEPATDYLEVAINTVLRIHVQEPKGDILLFLTGQEEIDDACEKIDSRIKSLPASIPELIPLPVYGALPAEMQSKIFEPAPDFARKVVVATNIAEASLTIDGVYYVVDPGFCKLKVFNAKTGMDALQVVPISQASAKQRAGRAGRTGPGQCYRLYTREAFTSEMLPATVPEMQRSNLANVVLNLKAMGIPDLLRFDWMDPPAPATLAEALQTLYALGALDEEGLLTRLGRRMAEFPLDPALAKILIAAVDLGCSDEILTVVSMLSVENIFFRPKDRQTVADQKHNKFHQPEGDHLTLLCVYDAWKDSGFGKAWCVENFLHARTLQKAHDVRKQLLSIMDRHHLDVVSCGKDFTRIRRAITSGYFTRAARKDPVEGYKTLSHGQTVYIHPSSSLFQKGPDWVIYHELVLTTKEYMRSVLAIDARWLFELAPRHFRKVDGHDMSRRKRRERIEPLYDRFNPPDLWRLSKRRM